MVKILLGVFLLLLGVVTWKYVDHEKEEQPVTQEKEQTPFERMFPGVELPEPGPAPELEARDLSKGLPTKGQWRGVPAVADLNGDGHVDLVVSIRRWSESKGGEGVYVFLGDGKGGWRASVEGMRRDMGYGGAEVGDVDGDGRLDVAFSGHDITPHVFLNQGDGKWKGSATGIEVEGICGDVALGDFDHDGKMDLATIGQFPKHGGLAVFKGDGAGGFKKTADLLRKSFYGNQILMQDLDGDGCLEIVASTSLGLKIWSYRDGEWQPDSKGISEPEVGGSEIGLQTWDVDGDGTQEIFLSGLVYQGHKTLQVYRRDGDGWKPWGTPLPDDEAFFDLTVARLGSSRQPCLVAAGKAGISIFSLPRSGEFQRLGRVAGTVGIFNVGAGDVNGDGDDELVFVGIDGVRVLDVDLIRN